MIISFTKKIFSKIKYYGFKDFNNAVISIILKRVFKLKFHNIETISKLKKLSKLFPINLYNETKYNPLNKNVLIVSHELSLTGAPITLVQLATTLEQLGYTPIITCPHDGPLLETFIQKNYFIITSYLILETNLLLSLSSFYRILFINTAVCGPVIKYFINKNQKLIWWIHESELSYNKKTINNLPMELSTNIKVFSVGDLAKRTLLKYRNNYQIENLLYSSPDFYNVNLIQSNQLNSKITFAIIGAICETKAQNILCDAIKLLPQNIIENSNFLFVGKNIETDNNIMNQILELQNNYPENIKYLGVMSRPEIEKFYYKIDCLISSSIYDSMPIVVTEALLMSKLVVCSENIGSASILEKEKSGFIYKNNNPEKLAEKIKFVYENKDHLENIKNNARKTYEKYFSEEAFKNNILSILK